MSYIIDEPFKDFPASGNAYLGTKGKSLDGYQSKLITTNLNYLTVARSPVLLSGYTTSSDAGDYALLSPGVFNTADSYLYRVRGRALMRYPYNTINAAFACARSAVGGTVRVLVSEDQLINGTEQARQEYTDTLITTDSWTLSTGRYTCAVRYVPVKNDRLVYIYFLLNKIDALGAYTVWASYV